MKRALLLLLFGALWWGSEYALRDFWEPDEARFAYVATEMQRDGHWAVPHRHGEWYAHKPPMLFWLQRASAALTGGAITPVSARLPSFAGAVLALGVTGLFAARWFGAGARWKAMLILATSFLFWREGGTGRMDALLCGLQLSALYLLFANDETPARWRPLAAYALMGAAVLTKGPVGLLVPLAVYAAATWAARGPRALARAHLLWGPLFALMLPAAWLLAARAEGAPAEYFRELLLKQNLDRVTGREGFGKPRPFHFYLAHFPAEFMPWTMFLPAALAAARRNSAHAQARQRLVAWFLAVLVFFSLSTGKRNLYILFAYPAASLYLASAWDSFAQLGAAWTRTPLVVATVLLAWLGAALLGAEFWPQRPLPVAALAPVGAVCLGAAALVWFGSGPRAAAPRFAACAAAFAAPMLAVTLFVLPAMNELKTPRSAVPLIQPHLAGGGRFVIFGETQELLPLLCGARSYSALTPAELSERMRRAGHGVVLCTEAAWQSGPSASLPPGTTPRIVRFGHKTLYWTPFDARAVGGGATP